MPGFGSLGGTELIIALVIILLLFGAKRIPELAKGLGSGVREFRKGTKEDPEEIEKDKKKEGEISGEKDETAEAQAEAQDSANDAESDLQEDVSVEADRQEQKRS